MLLALCVGSGAHADEKTREDELQGIRLEIDRLQAELEQVDDQADDLSGQLEQTSLELRLQEARVSEASTAYEGALVAAESAASRVVELESTLDRLRQDLEERLTVLYRFGSQGYLRLLLAVEREGDLLSSIRQLRYLVRRDAEALDRYLETREDLRIQEAELAERQAEVERWLASEEDRRAALRGVRRRQQALLVRVEEERETIEARTLELIDKEARLASLIELLVNQDQSDPGGTPIQEFRGVLDWPTRGDIITQFGPRQDPRYGTVVPHNGIEILTRPGSEVRVVFAGRVRFAASLEGYGFTAVVQHPDQVFTLYAGLSELVVATEDMLSLGDGVGRASDRLYFEVRAKNLPEDPLLWLR